MKISLDLTTTIALGAALIGILIGTKCCSALPRILGGTSAQPGQFPWTISLQNNDTDENDKTPGFKHDCGGAIVNQWTVLTAAHCAWNRKKSEMMVVAGAYNLKKEEKEQQRKGVAKIMMHPNYTSGSDPGPYDVAVLRLASPLTFNKRVKAIDMADEGERPKGACENSGWGNLFPVTPAHYRGSDVQITSKTNVVSMDSCKRAYVLNEKLLGTAVCATAGPLHGTCQGDSGGPLTCYRKDSTPYLAGLVSFGFQVCNNGFHPEVYSDVGNSEIYSFFQKNLGPSHNSTKKAKASKKNPEKSNSKNNNSPSPITDAQGALSSISMNFG